MKLRCSCHKIKNKKRSQKVLTSFYTFLYIRKYKNIKNTMRQAHNTINIIISPK